MTTGRIPHLLSVVAIFPKPFFIIYVSIPKTFDVLLSMAALRRNVVATVLYLVVIAAIHKGEFFLIIFARRSQCDLVHYFCPEPR